MAIKKRYYRVVKHGSKWLIEIFDGSTWRPAVGKTDFANDLQKTLLYIQRADINYDKGFFNNKIPLYYRHKHNALAALAAIEECNRDEIIDNNNYKQPFPKEKIFRLNYPGGTLP